MTLNLNASLVADTFSTTELFCFLTYNNVAKRLCTMVSFYQLSKIIFTSSKIVLISFNLYNLKWYIVIMLCLVINYSYHFLFIEENANFKYFRFEKQVMIVSNWKAFLSFGSNLKNTSTQNWHTDFKCYFLRKLDCFYWILTKMFNL